MAWRDEGYATTLPRAALAIVAGGLTGGVLVTVHWLRAAIGAFGLAFVEQAGARAVLLTFVGAVVIWLTGLVLIGAPAWWLLHRYRLRSWWAAVLAGMALTFVAGVILAIPVGSKGAAYSSADRGGAVVIDNRLTTHGWIEAAERAVLEAFVGGAVGWVVWRVAYRRA